LPFSPLISICICQHVQAIELPSNGTVFAVSYKTA
jgi:hypothetical protein